MVSDAFAEELNLNANQIADIHSEQERRSSAQVCWPTNVSHQKIPCLRNLCELAEAVSGGWQRVTPRLDGKDLFTHLVVPITTMAKILCEQMSSINIGASHRGCVHRQMAQRP